MSKQTWILVIGIAVALAVAGGVYLNTRNPKTLGDRNAPCTTIRFERDTLRLGQVVLGKTVPVAFRYTNTGDVPLLSKNVQTTGGCAEPIWEKAPLLPGESQEIKVEFTGESKGHFVKTIYVVCNIWKKVYPLLIIGDVVETE